MNLLIQLWRKIPKYVKYTLLLLFSTRLVFSIIGVFSRILLEPYHWQEYTWVETKHLWLDIWGVWDSGWYLSIANDGYSATKITEGVMTGQANYAFFPLYPLLMRVIGMLLQNTFIAGIVVSNISLIIACIFLYKLVRLEHDEGTALRSIKYMILFPTAFILSGVFSESLFLMLLLICFYYAKKGQWLLVGIFGYFLALTRSLGVIMLLPLFYEYLEQRSFDIEKIKANVIYLGLIPLGLVTFTIYNYYLTGDFLAFTHVLGAWGRGLGSPFSKLLVGFVSQYPEGRFIALFTTAFLVLLIAFFRRIGLTYALTGLLAVLVPLSTGLDSMPRYLLAAFPIFIVLACISKRETADSIATITLCLLQGFLMVFWSNGFYLII